MSLGNRVPSKFKIDVISRQDLEHANYTDINVLLNTHTEVPYFQNVFESSIDYVYSAVPNIYEAGDTSFLDAFVKSGSTIETEAFNIRHKMLSTGHLKIISMEPLMTGTTKIGIGASPILLKLNRRIFDVPDTIYPEIEPSLRFSIQKNPVTDGTGYIYELVLHDRMDNAYVDPEYFKEGMVWKKDGAAFSEGSGQWGTSSFGGTSMLVFESDLSSFSKQHEVTDDAYYYAARIRSINPKTGNPDNMIADQIIGFPEAQLIKQFKWEKQHTLFWGRSAGRRVIDTSTGKHRKIGSGAIEFLEDGNMLPYNRRRFSIGKLRDELTSIIHGKIRPENANFELWCGIGLFRLIDEALQTELNQYPFERKYEDYLKSGATFPGSKTSGKHMTSTMITGFDLKPYGSVTVKHLTTLDAVEGDQARRDPITGFPETSFWGFIPDLGFGTGNNMYMVKKKGAENYYYVSGGLTPLGYRNATSGTMAFGNSGKRTYSVHMGDICGVTMKDTKRTAFLLPSEKF